MKDLILKLKPYFISFREINENYFLDLKIPKDWLYNIESINETNIYIHPNKKEQGKSIDENFIFITFFVKTLDENIDKLFTYAETLITFNKNNEIKKDLFQQKLNELKILFEKESIDKLKELNFNEKI